MIPRMSVGLVVGALLTASMHLPAAPRTTTAAYTTPGGTYQLYAPPTAVPAPLVVVLPASGWSASQYRTLTGFDQVADTNRFAVAYLDPEHGRWNAGPGCCVQPEDTTHRDDPAFIRSVVADVQGRTLVDATRVYVVGGSGGAMMAWRMACAAPDVFAAAGVVAGAVMTNCARVPARVVRLHGSNDTAVPYCGGVAFEGRTFPSGPPPECTGSGAGWVQAARCPNCVITVRMYPGVGHVWMSDAASRLWASLAPVRRR